MSNRFTELWDQYSVANMLLSPLSRLYEVGWFAYLGVYRMGFKQAAEPHKPVVCVGNLRVGGMGKTPTTLHIAQVLQELGYPVVLGLSGYGSPASKAAQVCPDGPLSPKEWGDEPALARWCLPDLPIIAGRRRVLAAELCARHFPDSVLLMDDGFQHLPLVKHVTIVLDPPKPLNPLCMPAGPYREPRSSRSRADLVIPGEFSLVRSALKFWRAPDAEPVELKSLQGMEAAVVCALGMPESFLHTVSELGVKVVDARLLRDHDPLTKGNLWDGLRKELPIFMTLKDWVKVRERGDLAGRTLYYAHYEVTIEPSEAFRTWITKRLDEAVS